MPTRILHIADVHLDRPFVGLALDDARLRRRELRDALDRCLELAAHRDADLVTIGGDLWEDEHVTADTRRWVAERLATVAFPVVLISGNHDPLLPGGAYHRTVWPKNVHLLGADGKLGRIDVGDVTLWGMSWGATPLRSEPLVAFSTPPDGTHLLLLHGTVASASFDETAHCRFSADLVRRCGFDLCLAGHLHGGGIRDDIVVYPGSPEPLAWSETGRHCAAVVDLSPDAPPRIELVDVNHRRYTELAVACDGAASSADIERTAQEAITRAAGDAAGLCLRVILTGRVDPECQVDIAALRAGGSRAGLVLLDVRDDTEAAFDLDTLALAPTAVGAFVSDLRERIATSEGTQRHKLELALDLGLRAMHGDGFADAH